MKMLLIQIFCLCIRKGKILSSLLLFYRILYDLPFSLSFQPCEIIMFFNRPNSIEIDNFPYSIDQKINIEIAAQMDSKPFYNISNQSTLVYKKQYPRLMRAYTANSKESVTPLVIKHNPRQSSSKLINKKSTKNFMPKYLYNPPYAVQKQKLLYDIEKENMKLRHQNVIKKTLEKKLQKKIISTEKKAESLQKFNKTQAQSLDGIQRTITSSLQKAFVLQPNKNYLKSIKNQMQLLDSEINKNYQTILKIKQSKKYTRFMENEEQKNTFVAVLKNMNKYKKKLKLEINRLKRIHQEKKNIRIKELMMEGQIQNTVEMQNIQIYNMIQDVKESLKQKTFKKATLMKKRNTLIQQIDQLKERHNITDDIIEAYFKPNQSVMSLTSNSLGFYRSGDSTQYRSASNQLNDLGSLREEDQEEDESMENPNYQKVRLIKHRMNHSEDVVRQNAICTVKVHSNINSEDGNFNGRQSNDTVSEQKLLKQQQERQTMEKLDQKYFYEDENFQSDDQMSGKDYDSQQYDEEEGFESEEDDEEVQYLIENQKNKDKTRGQPQKNLENSRGKQWSNRHSRGISV